MHFLFRKLVPTSSKYRSVVPSANRRSRCLHQGLDFLVVTFQCWTGPGVDLPVYLEMGLEPVHPEIALPLVIEELDWAPGRGSDCCATHRDMPVQKLLNSS